MPTHNFEARLSWQSGGQGVASSNHRVDLAGRPAFEVSAAPQYRGDPTRLNPEELLLTAVASCQLLTYLALAPRASVNVRAYEDHAVGTLAIADKKMRMTEVVLRPRITVAPGTDTEQARVLVDKAHDGCFIANSVSCAVRIEPEIVVAGS
jgi:peroxiredoxin-like protein